MWKTTCTWEAQQTCPCCCSWVYKQRCGMAEARLLACFHHESHFSCWVLVFHMLHPIQPLLGTLTVFLEHATSVLAFLKRPSPAPWWPGLRWEQALSFKSPISLQPNPTTQLGGRHTAQSICKKQGAWNVSHSWESNTESNWLNPSGMPQSSDCPNSHLQHTWCLSQLRMRTP